MLFSLLIFPSLLDKLRSLFFVLSLLFSSDVAVLVELREVGLFLLGRHGF